MTDILVASNPKSMKSMYPTDEDWAEISVSEYHVTGMMLKT